jgi:serine/threonine protein kinase
MEKRLTGIPIRCCSAKHLDSSEQQLTSVAGSLGYLAPEVLNQKGHGRPVDLWSIGYCFFLPYGSFMTLCNADYTLQGHYLYASLRIYTLQVRRHEGNHTTNDRGEGQLSRQILEECVGRRYGKYPFLLMCECVSLTLGSGTAQQKTSSGRY